MCEDIQNINAVIENGVFYDIEFNVTNNIVQKERFRNFIKVPKLAAFYNSSSAFI